MNVYCRMLLRLKWYLSLQLHYKYIARVTVNNKLIHFQERIISKYVYIIIQTELTHKPLYGSIHIHTCSRPGTAAENRSKHKHVQQTGYCCREPLSIYTRATDRVLLQRTAVSIYTRATDRVLLQRTAVRIYTSATCNRPGTAIENRSKHIHGNLTAR